MMGSIIGGILLPVSFLQSEVFGVLAGFVAVNTLIFVGLAIGKMLPRVYVLDMIGKRGKNRRGGPRGILLKDGTTPAHAVPPSAPLVRPPLQPQPPADEMKTSPHL